MSIFKKVSAALISATMIFSLASCGSDTTYAAEINGYKVPAGVFIAFQMNAYYDALSYVEPVKENADPEVTVSETAASESASETAASETTAETTTTNITDKVIEGISSIEWINNEAEKSMKEFVAIENKFDELGLSFKEQEDSKAAVYLDQIWEYYGKTYEDLGISKESQLAIYINNYKRTAVFDYYYGAEGELAVSQDDVKNYIYDNYAQINYIKMELKDGEGNLFKSAQKEEALEMAKGYVSRAEGGEDFNAILKEYNDYYSGLVKAAQDAASDTTAPAADTATTEASSDNTTVISLGSANPSAAVVEKVFSTPEQNACFIVEEDEAYYVVKKTDILQTEGYLENNDSAARHALKDEEFQTTIEGWRDEMTSVRNEAAFKRYKISKFEQEK